MAGVALITLTVAAVALTIAGWWARIRLSQRQVQETMIEEFTETAEKLISDKDVPDRVAIAFYRMARSVYGRTYNRSLFRFLLASRRKRDASMREENRLFDAITALPEPLERMAIRGVVTYAYSTTFNNFVIGWILRRTFWAAAMPPKAVSSPTDPRIAAIVHEVPHDNCAVPA
jgi:hypothetical protein